MFNVFVYHCVTRNHFISVPVFTFCVLRSFEPYERITETKRKKAVLYTNAESSRNTTDHLNTFSSIK